MRLPVLFVLGAIAATTACSSAPPEEKVQSGSDALGAVDVACGANTAQIGLSGTGAAVAVAGYLTAAAVAVEGLVAAGADTAILSFAQSMSRALIQIGGASTEAGLLGEAVAAKDVVMAGKLLVAVLGKMALSGDVRNVLTIGYRVLEALKDGLVDLDGANPLGVQHNLDVLNDGLRFACHNCGEQWACSAGETASRMVDFDATRHQENDTAAISQGRDCAAATTFWSTSSYLDQCYDCCTDAGYTDDQTSGWHACRAVCNAAYK